MVASPQFSDYVSAIALVVALLSFVASFYFGFRDRVNVKAFSTYYEGYCSIKIVNHGRRAAIITMFGGDLENGYWQATHLGEKGLGIRLAEHEFHTENFSERDILAIGPDHESEFINLWFEDSLGKRHLVKDSEEHLQRLKG